MSIPLGRAAAPGSLSMGTMSKVNCWSPERVVTVGLPSVLALALKKEIINRTATREEQSNDKPSFFI